MKNELVSKEPRVYTLEEHKTSSREAGGGLNPEILELLQTKAPVRPERAPLNIVPMEFRRTDDTSGIGRFDSRALRHYVPSSGSDMSFVDSIGTRESPRTLRRKGRDELGNVAIALGFWEHGDGGGGTFYWVEDELVDDGGTVVRGDGGNWRRLDSGPLNVRWYGAHPQNDSERNDQAFTDALLAIESRGGGQLFIPAGTYRYSQPLNLTSGVRITGEGRSRDSQATTLRYLGSTVALNLEGGSTKVEHVCIEHLRIAGEMRDAGDGITALIRLRFADNNTFRDLVLDGSRDGSRGADRGIWFHAENTGSGCYYNLFDNINIEKCNYGVWIQTSTDETDPNTRCNANLFSRVRVKGYQGDEDPHSERGFYLAKAQANTFLSCISERNATHLRIEKDTKWTQFLGGYFEHDEGFDIDTSANDTSTAGVQDGGLNIMGVRVSGGEGGHIAPGSRYRSFDKGVEVTEVSKRLPFG